MNGLLKVMLEKAAENKDRKKDTNEIVSCSGLDYRTVTALIKMRSSETSITDEILDELSSVNYYTKRNVINLAKKGLSDLIPYEYYEDDEFLEKTGITSIPDHFLDGCESVKDFNLSSKIKTIGEAAFSNCKNLKIISIMDNSELITIENGAFKNCKSLLIEDIPDTVTYIGEDAFNGCESIQNFHVSKNIHCINERTFYNCTMMETFKAESPIIEVKEKAFMNCTSLKDINTAIKSPGKESFCNCIYLNKVRLNTTTVHTKAFSKCLRLKEIIFEEKVPSVIEKNIFKDCNMISVISTNGYPFQLREAEGYQELIKDIKVINENGKKRLSYNITYLNTVAKALS